MIAGPPPPCATRWMSAAPKSTASPALQAALDRRAAEREALLDHRPACDGERAAGDVVVVKARVVVVHPADEPDRDVLVAQELLVRAGVRVVVDEVAPALRPCGEVGHQRAQFVACEVAPGRHELVAREVAAGRHELVAREVAPGRHELGRRIDHAATATESPPSRRATFAPTIASCAAAPSGAAGCASTTGRSEP